MSSFTSSDKSGLRLVVKKSSEALSVFEKNQITPYHKVFE